MERAAARLDELYAAHAVYLNRFMLKLTRNREEAADLVQDIFLRLCQQDRVPEHPKAWLSRTGYRLFVDRCRRKHRYNWVPLDDSLASRATPEQAVLDMEFEQFVQRLLLRLNPRPRAAFRLRIYGQYSYGEIARQLGCPENTVKAWMRRGKAQLSEWL